jgi:hypothetical protein
MSFEIENLQCLVVGLLENAADKTIALISQVKLLKERKMPRSKDYFNRLQPKDKIFQN